MIDLAIRWEAASTYHVLAVAVLAMVAATIAQAETLTGIEARSSPQADAFLAYERALIEGGPDPRRRISHPRSGLILKGWRRYSARKASTSSFPAYAAAHRGMPTKANRERHGQLRARLVAHRRRLVLDHSPEARGVLHDVTILAHDPVLLSVTQRRQSPSRAAHRLPCI